MNLNEEMITTIVNQIKKELEMNKNEVEVEASGRHVHLSREAVDALFGEGYQLTKVKDLSQPGQFACKERITIVGPNGALQNVVILGPERPASQVEVSLTDSRILGVKVPIRESGQIEETPGIVLVNGDRAVALTKGLIIAKRHVHMTPEDAIALGVKNGEIVQVAVQSERSLIFDDVVLRVSPKFATYMHIDYDEANACNWSKGMKGKILKKREGYE